LLTLLVNLGYQMVTTPTKLT